MSSPHLGATVPGLSWCIGSLLFGRWLRSQRAPIRQAHLQGGTLRACTIHYQSLGHSQKPTEKSPRSKTHRKKNPGKKCMGKNSWTYLLLTREHTPKPPSQAVHSLTPSPLHTHRPRHLPTQAPTHPGTHPPRHSPTHPGTHPPTYSPPYLTCTHSLPKKNTYWTDRYWTDRYWTDRY